MKKDAELKKLVSERVTLLREYSEVSSRLGPNAKDRTKRNAERAAKRSELRKKLQENAELIATRTTALLLKANG